MDNKDIYLAGRPLRRLKMRMKPRNWEGKSGHRCKRSNYGKQIKEARLQH
jgi:hypothetical protein